MNQNPNFNLWLIPILPLVGSAINGLFGKRFPRNLVSGVALLFPGAALAYAIWVVTQFSNLAQSQVPHIERLFPWIEANGFRAEYGF
jgi:NADH-quinone oxidoreductase subunit L